MNTQLKLFDSLNNHLTNTLNPHFVTSSQVGTPVSHKHSASDISSVIPLTGGVLGQAVQLQLEVIWG